MIRASQVSSGGRTFALGWALQAAALAISLAGGGCAHSRSEARRFPAWVFQGSHHVPGKGTGENTAQGDRVIVVAPRVRPRGGIRGRSEASDFVVAALQDTGLRFGTDGSVESLWGYLRTSHVVVSPLDARRGDIVFFQASRPSSAPKTHSSCDDPNHAGIVSTVDGNGRIGFVDVRDGALNGSYVDPLRPQLRRDAEGRIHNSFLRQKKIGDPPDSPNFAGEMLCGVARPRS